jgi:nicotinate-nucleotide pyrophosphorylase (carboxylating)
MGSNKNFPLKSNPELEPAKLDTIIRRALIEDIGRGDITTQLTIPKDKKIDAEITVKEDCIICGLKVVERVFNISDKNIIFKPLAREGHPVKKARPFPGSRGWPAAS